MAEAPTTLKILEAFTGNVSVDNMIVIAAWTIFIPMLAAVFLIFWRYLEIYKGREVNPKFSSIIGVGSIAISSGLSIILAIQYFVNFVSGSPTYIHGSVPFIVGTKLTWELMVDPLSILMSLVLAVIGLFIHIYASDYMMHGEPEITRFFAFMNFFTAAMWGFVYAGNLITSFVFWELLGVSSYFLIGYYWHKASASAAGMKAFLYNKVGDVGFMVGIFTVMRLTGGDVSYVKIMELVHTGALSANDFLLPSLLIFIGAVGKSSQFPLFGWLPEAMEGPTPVSALLHSSTMVKAGLFLLIRNFMTFYDVNNFHATLPTVSWFTGFYLPTGTVITWIGAITALLGALMALTSTDIKRILAFSTISQLGYIASGIGAGATSPAFYHIVSHATFKSLLFLCAGAVIHNLHHTQDIREMGGLFRHMKITGITMGIGLIALAGIPPFSGFWSKDSIILGIANSNVEGAVFLQWLEIVTAFITAFYSMRMFYVVFLGEERFDKEKVIPRDSSKLMAIPLIGVASLVILESLWFSIGYIPGLESLNFEKILGDLFGVHPSTAGEVEGWLIGSLFSISGALAALLFYWKYPDTLQAIRQKLLWAEDFINNRFYVDKSIYGFVDYVAMPTAEALKTFDYNVIDKLIINDIVFEGALMTAEESDRFDQNIIDGVVNGFAALTRSTARYGRRLQDGIVRNYATLMMVSLAVFLIAFGVSNQLKLF